MRPPPYFDAVIQAWRTGQAGRDVHLGYYHEGPADSFVHAQARLTQMVLAQLPLSPGQHVVDIACGLGGGLAMANERLIGGDLTGVNIDPRQLAICRGIAPRAGNRLRLVLGDACRLPLRQGCADHTMCLEAMFHFASRATFLAEAARILRPGGVLAITDILLHPPSSPLPWPAPTMLAVIRRDYGAWPEPWMTWAEILHAASDAGLETIADADWTTATRPSYAVISPGPAPERNPDPDAGAVFRWLHHNGGLSYRMAAFRRRRP